LLAGDDREGHNICPPFILLLQSVWISYLAIYISEYSPFTHGFNLDMAISEIKEGIGFMLFAPLGRNPRLLVGYMQNGSHHGEHEPPPL
jgi:hypothetical protein